MVRHALFVAVLAVAALFGGSVGGRWLAGPAGPPPRVAAAPTVPLPVRPATFAPDGAWCWFGNPRAVYHHATHDRVFYGWITRGGAIQVGQYDRQTHQKAIAEIATGLRIDDHSNPSMVMLPDGRLMVFWTGHASAVPIRYRIATKPESVLSWGPVRTYATGTPGRTRYSYPNPVYVPGDGPHGRLYLFWRSGSDTALTWTDDLGEHWAPSELVVSNPGARPYTKVVADGRGGIDLTTTDGHPDEVSVNNVYFTRFYRGALYRADGTLIRDLRDGPATPHDLDLVHSQAADHTEGWVWDIAVARDGTPVIALADFPSRRAHRYRYATWSAAHGWQEQVLLADAGASIATVGHQPSYSGGISLDPDDPSVVYLSRRVGPHYEIERRATADGGRTWTVTAVTVHSDRDNIRPVVVAGAGESGAGAVLWLAGRYVHYTRYRTAVAGFPDR